MKEYFSSAHDLQEVQMMQHPVEHFSGNWAEGKL